MLRYLTALLSLYKIIDLIVDHREQIQRLAPGVAMIGIWIASAGAWLLGESLVVIIALAITILTVIFVLLTYIPWWLEKRHPRPFAVEANEMFTTARNIQVKVSVFNRSQQNRIALEFGLFLKAEGRPETWFSSVELQGVEQNLGPQQSTEGYISIEIPSPRLLGTDYTGNVDFETRLRVVDRLSGRWVKFKIPGYFPPDFFRLS